jgi:hypothetical protein
MRHRATKSATNGIPQEINIGQVVGKKIENADIKQNNQA